MSRSASTSRGGQFMLGVLISFMLSCIALPLGFFGSVFMYFAGPGNPFVLPAIILVPVVLAITTKLVTGNRARAFGAIAFYPCTGLVIYVAYALSSLAAEREAAERNKYASRVIAQPLGLMDVVGIPLARQRCIDTCARILLNGVANEVAGISYDKIIDLQNAYNTGGKGRKGSPWVFRRFRLGRCAECLAQPVFDATAGTMSWTGADVQWIQSNGIYDVCIVGSVGGADLGNMILIDHGPDARRPNAPKGNPNEPGPAAASRIVNGHRSEIVRWEIGVPERGVLPTGGGPFTLWDFVKALSGKGEPDRLSDQDAIGLRTAIDRISANIGTMPNMDGWAPFEFLRKVHERETGIGRKRGLPRCHRGGDVATDSISCLPSAIPAHEAVGLLRALQRGGRPDLHTGRGCRSARAAAALALAARLTPRRASSAGWSTTSCTGTRAACPGRCSGAPSATSARPRGSRRE